MEALENCVSMYPNLSGRFSALSGISFVWDCSKKPGERVLHETVKIDGQDLKKDRLYRVAMHSFMGSGGDGYQSFKKGEVCTSYVEKNNVVLIS